jgi:hypothetical protein
MESRFCRGYEIPNLRLSVRAIGRGRFAQHGKITKDTKTENLTPRRKEKPDFEQKQTGAQVPSMVSTSPPRAK